jgi:hypothetical protein
MALLRDSVSLPDLSLTLSHRQRDCVLDPTLVLSRFGLPLIRRLGGFIEMWMPRELWHILDNSQFYMEHPETLCSSEGAENQDELRWNEDEDEIVSAITLWERVRLESDLSGLKVFWLGDGLSESFVPPGTTAGLVWRYEALAQALDRRLKSSGPVACAARDTIALAAALGTAFVLTNRTADSSDAENAPDICKALAYHMSCELVPKADRIAAIESDYLRQLLVHASSADLLWSGLNLAVLHLALPSASALDGASRHTFGDDLGEVGSAKRAEIASDIDLWEGARAFWYPL